MSSNRNGKTGPAHMASGRQKKEKGLARRREPLRDRYTYEEPMEDGQGFEDVTSYSSSRQKKEDQKELERQRGKKRMSTGKKAAIIVAAVVLLLIGAGAYYVFGYVLRDLPAAIAPITKDKEKLGINSQVQTDASIKNIALFGLDARDDEFEGRSDAIIILTVDTKHNKIKMTSILRDSNVSIMPEDDYGNPYYMDDKITHAYFYGGPDLAVQTINRNFFLNIEDYVTVNFAKMAKIVDACGGVRIPITYDEMLEINYNLDLQINESNDTDITYEDYLYEDGDVLLNGHQAVAYARIRHLDSDDMRASRQQTVLKALLEQAKGKSKLEYPELIRQLLPLCKTSLDFADAVSMVPIMLTDFTIETMTVPGEPENPSGGINSQGGWVYLYDLQEAAKHVNQFIYEETAPSDIYLDEHVISVSEIALYGGYSSSSSDGGDGSDDENSNPPESSGVTSENPDTSSSSSDVSSSDVSSSGGEGEPSSSQPGGEEGEPSSNPASQPEEGDSSSEDEPAPEDETGGEDWSEGAANGDVTM